MALRMMAADLGRASPRASKRVCQHEERNCLQTAGKLIRSRQDGDKDLADEARIFETLSVELFGCLVA